MNRSTMRRRLEMQGYVGLRDDEVASVSIGSRFAPTVCLALVIVATALRSSTLFLLLVPFAASGALLRRHPLDSLYNLIVPRLTGTATLPRHGVPRRFACGLASLFLTVGGVSLATHHMTMATIVAAAMIVVPGVQVLTGFCMPSFLLGKLRRLAARRRRPAPLHTV